jgi:hypothetical protein
MSAKLKDETVLEVTEYISKTVTEMHEAMGYQPKSWSANVGQWLVYGLEKYFGFPACVELEALVERAWRKGQPIEPVVEAFLRSL